MHNNEDEQEIERLSILGRRANTGFILGIIGLIAWMFMPLVGIVVSVLGIVFSSIGFPSYLKGKAIAGLVLSILGLVLSVISAV